MFVKKLNRFSVLLLMVLAVISLGSFSVFAESSDATQPVVRENAITVELNDNYFNPKTITLPKGVATKAILKNNGQKEHTFTVEKLGIDAVVQAGTTKTISVKPTMPGTYELICRYHFQTGMVGKVIVK
ncbi:cupredoxin domain-containing protein [Neobacillus piezotolerans]|uniref:Cupredoxin domain-containing protein n=1 Tax=Neobacillus piezotolerans TaxID=2259171 RepID=A0A3D8GXU8_9BACI|nr:cupredoxin domain-containing protein [Neobacillus piezotolerans]RDU38886.1 cupredoxin domain-containing protein [Neobacillus piezotolerans]